MPEYLPLAGSQWPFLRPAIRSNTPDLPKLRTRVRLLVTLLFGRTTISSHRPPEDLKSLLKELFALLRLFRDEFHCCFLHRCHSGRRETRRQTAQRATGFQCAQRSFDCFALGGCSHTCFGCDQVRYVQLHRSLAFLWKFDRPIENA